jgi:hypothetical protein
MNTLKQAEVYEYIYEQHKMRTYKYYIICYCICPYVVFNVQLTEEARLNA